MSDPGCFSPEMTRAADMLGGASALPEAVSFLADSRLSSPDVLDSLANLSSDEVFTPPQIANAMLDLLPEEVWSDPDLRWLDPAVKSGVFLREAARRLLEGLAEKIPDEDARREHIFKNMLFGIAITELTGLIGRRTLYYSKDASSRYSVVQFDCTHGNIEQKRSLHTFKGSACVSCGAPKTLERGESMENYAYPFIHETIEELFPQISDTGRFPNMKFDVIIGNPPYQLESGGFGAQATPLYHKFVEKALALRPRYISFIIPARWYAGGMGLDQFRKTMLEDRSISVLVDYPDASQVFPGVEIKGGVCYFLRDSEHDGDCKVVSMLSDESPSETVRDLRSDGDVFVRFNQAGSIVRKVLDHRDGFSTFSALVSPIDPFGFPTNFKSGSPKPGAGKIKLYQRGGFSYVDKSKVSKHPGWVGKYKVLVPKASDGSGSYPVSVLGKPLLAEPESACTMTYIAVGPFDGKSEADNAADFLRTRFVRFLIGMRKSTQNVNSGLFAFVPKLDMTRKWADADLYERYGLDEDEITFIEKMIKEMPA
jgi:site-specific DNA-methyltransferase (adenine-specific)